MGLSIHHVSVGNPRKSLYMKPLVCTVPQYPPWHIVRACSFAGVDSLEGLPHLCCGHTEGRVTGWWCKSGAGGVSGSSKRE